MNINILEKVGFTKGEIRIYQALLELGETTTGPIIDRSRISSSKVYEILEKLIQKGMVSYITRGQTRYFQPASPERLKDYLEGEKKSFEETEKEIYQIIPLLEEKSKKENQEQTVVVYEGFEGIKTVFMKILDELQRGDEYYAFTVDEEATAKELRIFFLNYHAKRIPKGVKVKLLSKIENKQYIEKNYPKYKYSERRYIDHAYPNGIFVFKNHVMHFTYSPKPTLIVISSNQTYNSYKAYFLEMWDKAQG